MKFKLLLLLQLVSVQLLFTSLAQAKPIIDTRENKVIVRQVINAPANLVWSQIGRVDGVENFIPQVFSETSVEGKGLGATRICKHHDGRTLVEEIVAFDEGSMTLSYTLLKGGESFPSENIVNTVQVHPISSKQSMLVWASKYDDKANTDPAMTKELNQGALSYVVAGAKRYIETLTN